MGPSGTISRATPDRLAGRLDAPRPGILALQKFDPVFLNHGIRENLVSDHFHILARLLRRDAIGNGDLEELALTHIFDAGVAETLERRANSLALRVKHRGLE